MISQQLDSKSMMDELASEYTIEGHKICAPNDWTS